MIELPLDEGRPVRTLAQAAETFASAAVATHMTCVDAAPGATALLLTELLARTTRPVVAVVDTPASAIALRDDLAVARPSSNAALFPVAEATVFAAAPPDRNVAQRRVAALVALHEAPSRPLWIVPATALLRKVVPAALLAALTETLRIGSELDRDALLIRLAERGYLRVPLVEDRGTFSARGGLIDVWPATSPQPLRFELDGDTIASIKAFDRDDQRTSGALELAKLVPARETLPVPPEDVATRIRELCDTVDFPSSKTRALIDDVISGRAFPGAGAYLPAFVTLAPLAQQLPSDALVVLEAPDSIARALDEEIERAERDRNTATTRPSFSHADFYLEPTAISTWLAEQPTLALAASSLRTEGHGLSGPCCHADDDTPSLATSDQHDLRRAIATARASSGHAASLEPLVARIRAWQTAGLGVVFGAPTTTQAERLALMLNNRQVTAKITAAHGDPVAAWASDPSVVRIVIGRLTRGVIAPTAGLALVTEEEIFGSRVHRRRTVRRRGRDRALEDLRALTTGDYVVHVDHGIGRYHGLVHRQVGGHQVELIEVHYAGGDKLYLPVHRLNQIHKLRGANSSPKLDRLGGQSFAHTKSRTRKKVRRIADELVRLYAERQAARGVATPPVDDEYHAFAASFPFEETDDQLRAIDEVAVDLQSERPMDRLVCGDVGFGKTEVALRAAFRVAMAGRQVAVLCPTTVLAQQHQLTFEARLRDYPLRIEALSRFTSKKQQTRILRELSSGQIDILVGTHRVLSKDVHFKELGLLVVDEEQRFGVTHKERLKSLKTNVDVLTLTATPIPRTLQMAVSGLRDMSIITTPPADRRAVRTIVSRSDPEMVREALERELGRGGQVFYVYNRIEGLTERAALVQALVPNARVRVAHGQMGERALERTMLEFVAGQSDILCSTAIIENGLDIARCNTIIIDRADLFGMTQLYQLRGRVGRSKERAYCYLMLPPHDQLSSDAAARVEALQRHSALGSGFEIAALDLDLRGAGDVLGAEQSGTIATIGFEMFCRMLDEAVHELRGEPHADEVEPELSLDVEALFPERYIPDIGLRLSLYKRLSSARSNEEIDAVAEEIEDRFGRAPESARRLLQLMQLKVALRSLRVLACEASARAVTFTLRDDAPIDAGKLATLVSARKDCFKLSPDARLTRRANQGELFQSGLDAAQTLVTELHGVMT